ncbi:DUF4926 domain-containing protein [Rhodoferax saidenbachensis]|uniref:Uncharacterized protein n=1 Tax=Rhodoferax saidenbachensis TaxID=1484693 RepID=A0ABU1ZT02_9BURK|nr:DUF4926 domain-containing protein [Rhodoferax saidenbachensis]MDR7307960.1 hypothetical protein [Rhodoferax saidenbachensis]
MQLENRYPELEYFWKNYTRNQQKAVRRMQRDLLSKMQRTDFAPLTPAQHAALGKAATAQHGAVLDSLLDVVPPRPVPVLTTAQEAWLRGINCEAFSLENAVKLYANRVKPGATGVVVHTYKDGEAYEVEVLREDGNTLSVDTVTATELQEMARMEARDHVGDDALIARMQSTPDFGGGTLVELSAFVHRRRRSKK